MNGWGAHKYKTNFSFVVKVCKFGPRLRKPWRSNTTIDGPKGKDVGGGISHVSGPARSVGHVSGLGGENYPSDDFNGDHYAIAICQGKENHPMVVEYGVQDLSIKKENF